jgi:transketolase
VNDIQNMAQAIRFLALDSILNAGEGHQGVPLGMAEVAATLFAKHVTLCPSDPHWPDRDRVVLSNGHGSLLLYALLHLSGYEAVSLDALKRFRQLGSVCAGHPEIEQSAGIEITTGLLGQGIACAAGMAVAEARLAADFGPGLVDHRTWVFVGDGCLQEGMGQEAISLAGHLRLGKLCFLWDDNQITDDGDTGLSISENVPARFSAAGWHVQEVDGHDIAALDAAMAATRHDERPSLIACRTVIACGLPRLEGTRGGHSAPVTPQDSDEMRAALGWEYPAFAVPDAIRADWTAAMDKGRRARAAWQARLAADPQADAFEHRLRGDLPSDWPQTCADLNREAGGATDPRPTILSSADVCDVLATRLPETQVLCADLEAPTDHKRGRAAFDRHNRAGSYVHCGVREHLMGAMVCGMAAHGGVRPINVTYLAFADYERAAMRMAALMGLPALFVFSHDSIGVGSNGPTHQPVEILASFRAMPNMYVFRPADAVEVAQAWQIALERRQGPSLLALSKQPAEQVCARNGSAQVARGAYVLRDCARVRDVTLLATGTEVALAVQAQDALRAQGVAAAVVSMPCWEIFAEQDAAYQSDVLGTAPRLGIEAAMKFGWERWLRAGDSFVGMDGFGASARAEVLYRHFGLTVERIVEEVCQMIGTSG